MNVHETYGYLTRARRDLWDVLTQVPEELLSRPLLPGERFRCIKDLLFHIPDVEDGWIHGDILREPMVQRAFPDLMGTAGGPVYAGFDLEVLLTYWRAVEQGTLTYLEGLTEVELGRVVTLEDSGERFTVSGLLWHVMIHEMRHTAQIVVLLRTQGVTPPSLDLLFYLPKA